MKHKSNPKKEKTMFGALTADAVLNLLKSDGVRGLSEEEVATRLNTYGENVIESNEKSSAFLIFLRQFKSPLILILIVASVVTIMVGHLQDAIFIFSAVVVNTILGFYQENKAEKSLAELKTYIKQRSRVVRGGLEKEVEAVKLVPGDVVTLSQGDRVSADARLLFVNDFEVDEAILTGESLPSVKNLQPADEKAALGDQYSMVFAGTLVTQGIARAVVCRTGFDTELGQIASLVANSMKEETPLQASIRKFSLQMGIVIVLLTAVIFIVGLLSGYLWIDMFLTAIAIAISAIPEGLPIAVTVILAIGVQRMAKRKGVVRKLVAAEALGSVTVVLTDKTGTLTLAQMELNRIIPRAEADEKKMIELALLNADVLIENPNDAPTDWRVIGRVIETSLVRGAAKLGIMYPVVKEKALIMSAMPFNAVNKFSVSLVKMHSKYFMVFLGAPDILVRHSTLNNKDKDGELLKINTLAGQGELVLGLAIKEVEPKADFVFSKDLDASNLSLLGLMTFRDPIRASVKDAISSVISAGIRIVLLTGDHRGTAQAVAKEVGLSAADASILDAPELALMTDEDLKKRLASVSVIARVSPADKMRIAKLFQEMGEVVAMTGDGVNDAPSLKQSDIGIAMGSGTEVARDVADLVLLDDNFETIAAAVHEGRQIFSNIQKAIVYLLSNVADNLFLIGGALIFGLPLPLNALQILWVNFFSDSFPAIALGFENGIDKLSGSPNTRSLFNPLVKFLIIFIGLFTSAFLFGIYWLLIHLGFELEIVRTFIFAAFGSYSLFLALSVRSLERSIFSYNPFSNLYLVGGISVGLVLMAAAIYVPSLQSIFQTVSLPLVWVGAVLALGAFNILMVEGGKAYFNRSRNR